MTSNLATEGVSDERLAGLAQGGDAEISVVAREVLRLRGFRDVLIDALIVNHIYRKSHEDNPDVALAELIMWEQKCDLDPAISEEACKLRDTYLSPEPGGSKVTFHVVAYDEGGYGDNRSRDFATSEEAVTYAKSLPLNFHAAAWKKVTPNIPPAELLWRAQPETKEGGL